MHTDEAVNAYIVGQLLAGGRFSYDPQDRHGPVPTDNAAYGTTEELFARIALVFSPCTTLLK
jgi:hypothetical protein